MGGGVARGKGASRGVYNSHIVCVCWGKDGEGGVGSVVGDWHQELPKRMYLSVEGCGGPRRGVREGCRLDN